MLKPTLMLLALGCAGTAGPVLATEGCAAQSDVDVVPLVELYTSEGCSSCPPADRWLSQQLPAGKANFLAFHVDYWDDIGWPDRFGSSRYSLRQRRRVAAAGGRTVYTPQVMVGATVQAPWSNPQAWQAILRQAQQQPAPVALALRLHRAGAGWQATVAASPSKPLGDDARLWLARYVDGQTTAVRAGENRGVTLHHDRVVRQLSGPWQIGADAVSQRMALPAEAAPWGVTAFVQDASGRVLQSLDLPVARCPAGSAG
jgi:hypothetical protein